MTIFDSLPENSFRRLAKVIVRTIHLVGIAGLFGNVMIGNINTAYIYLTVISGVILTLMEAYSGTIWFVQLRGVAVYVKLLLLLPIHFYSNSAVPYLIIVIIISGFMSHAPAWIRYFSLRHGKVILSQNDILG